MSLDGGSSGELPKWAGATSSRDISRGMGIQQEKSRGCIPNPISGISQLDSGYALS